VKLGIAGLSALLLPAGLYLACHAAASAVADPPVVPDTGPIADECAQACAAIRGAFNASRCPAAGPACELACRTDQAQGTAALLDVDCVIEAGAHAGALAACHIGCSP
jgi:hypothetical protein